MLDIPQAPGRMDDPHGRRARSGLHRPKIRRYRPSLGPRLVHNVATTNGEPAGQRPTEMIRPDHGRSQGTRPDQRPGRGGEAGPHRPRHARQRGSPPHCHRGAFRRCPGRGHPRPRPGRRRDPGDSSTAREALAETRRLLGVLRTEGGLELRQPIPGLSDLDSLFTRVRAAGLPVRYERSGPPGDTPPGVQLVISRLVQEALTNTIKHEAPAPARPSGCGSNRARYASKSRTTALAAPEYPALPAA